MIHHKYLLAAGLGLVVTCGIVCIKYHSPLKTQNSEAITNRLDTIQAQLGIVHQEVKNISAEPMLQKIFDFNCITHKVVTKTKLVLILIYEKKVLDVTLFF